MSHHASPPATSRIGFLVGATLLALSAPLAASDVGVSLVRRQFKEQVRVVADGGDPIGVWFDESQAPPPVVAGNYVVGPDTDLDTIPLAETMDR